MKFSIKLLLLTLLLSSPPLMAQYISPYLTEVNYNMDVDYVNATPVYIYHNVIIIDELLGTSDTSRSPTLISEVRASHVDGYHEDAFGIRYFSFDTDVKLDGIYYLKSDIIRCVDYPCTAYSLFFNSLFQPLSYININAFTLDPNNGDLIFSIENDARIDGVSYVASDIIRFNNTSGFSLFYDSIFALDDFARYKNIDGLSYLDNEHILVSFQDNDIVNTVYDFNTVSKVWSIAYTPLGLGENYAGINITSLMGYSNDRFNI